jgi:hypothetical protein
MGRATQDQDPTAFLAEVVAGLEAAGVEAEALDGLVHDMADTKAIGINQEGLDAQRAYVGAETVKGLSPAAREDYIFDSAHEDAANANNEGLDRQVEFLAAELGPAALSETIENALLEDGVKIQLPRWGE